MLATKAAIGWDMSADQTAQKLAEIKAATGWTIPELEDFADKVNMLGDTSAAKESDILEMFQRTGSAAEAAGVSFDITLASLTALRSIGMREETSARFFNAFASKLRTATHLPKKAAAGFKALGTSAKQVEKGMKTDSLGTMINLLERLDKSPDKAAAAINIFGQEWWDEAARMGRAVPEIIKNLKALQDPANWKGSLEKNLNVELSMTANHLERLKALASDVGDRLGRWALPGINASVEGLIGAVERLDNSAGVWDRKTAEYKAEMEERKRLGLDNEQPTEKGGWTDTSEEGGRIQHQKLARLVTGNDNEDRTLGEIITDWALGKKGGAADELREARRKGIANAQDAKTQQQASDINRANQTRTMAQTERQRLSAGPQRPETQQRIAELDKAITRADEEISSLRGQLHARLANANDELSQSRRGPIFGINGPNIPLTGTSGIGKTDARTWHDLRLGAKPILSGNASGSGDAGAQAGNVANNVRSALNGSDLAAAGRQAMDKYAAGLLSGGDAAVQAAASVAGRVNAALSTAGTGGGRAGARLSGQLHDGATGQ